MKKLVVYYSFEGNSRLIAKTMATEAGADLLELKPIKEIPNKGFGKFFSGGKQVLFKETPELKSIDKDAVQYDLIIMGSPVWAGTYAPAFNTFFSKLKLTNKKLAFFCCYKGAPGKTLENYKKILEGNEFLGEISFREPKSYETDKAIKEAKQFVSNILKKL